MPGFGYLLGGAIVALSSPRAAYAIAGGGLLILLLGALPLRARLRRNGAIHDPLPGATLPDSFGTRPTVEAGPAATAPERRHGLPTTNSGVSDRAAPVAEAIRRGLIR